MRKRDASLRVDRRLAAIEGVTGKDALAAMDANRLSEKLMGDTVFANVMMLGFAWQKGLVPVSLNALTQAIVLNGVAIEKNHRAFLIGRLAADRPEALKGLLDPKPQTDGTLDEIVTRREAFLTDYQNTAYAARYRRLVDRVRTAEAPLGNDAVSRAVARSLFKLMAYKDEYEVARLHTETGFSARIADEFEGDYRIVHHLAPPFLASGSDARGRPLKREFGPWVRLPFRMLARMKRLRGTVFDPFGYTAERRMERELIGWYEAHVEKALSKLDAGNAAELAETLALPMQIRGYGPVKEEAAERIRAEVDARL